MRARTFAALTGAAAVACALVVTAPAQAQQPTAARAASETTIAPTTAPAEEGRAGEEARKALALLQNGKAS